MEKQCRKLPRKWLGTKICISNHVLSDLSGNRGHANLQGSMRRPATNRSVHPKKPSESMALSGNRGHASFAALTMARPLFGMTPARSRTRKTSAISASVAGIAVTRTHSGAKRTGRNDGNAGHANAARTTCGAIISVGNLAVGPRFVDSPVRIAGEGRVDVGRVPGAGIAVTRVRQRENAGEKD